MTPLDYNKGQVSGLCIIDNPKILPAFYGFRFTDVRLTEMFLEGRILVRGRVGFG